MRTQTLACILLTGLLMSTVAQASDAEITIRVMDIEENSADAVMRVIPLPDETQLRQMQQQLNSDTEQAQVRQREMEMQQEQIQPIEIEAQHNQPFQDQLFDQGNMPQQEIDLQSSHEQTGELTGQRR